jgi:RNA polymerase sigma-70 factor (ECF subfamily)
MPPDNEKELLKRIKQDPQAFALVYDEHYNSIFSYVFRRLANYDVARDVTAETFLKAYQKIGVLEWRNIPISAWLFRIATNEINLYFRNSKYRPACIDDTDLHLHLSYEEGIETEKAALEKALQESNEFLMIQKQLLQLDLKYQEVIALRFFEEKPIKEIATILSKKEGTVKSLLSRGLEKLRKAALSLPQVERGWGEARCNPF